MLRKDLSESLRNANQGEINDSSISKSRTPKFLSGNNVTMEIFEYLAKDIGSKEFDFKSLQGGYY